MLSLETNFFITLVSTTANLLLSTAGHVQYLGALSSTALRFHLEYELWRNIVGQIHTLVSATHRYSVPRPTIVVNEHIIVLLNKKEAKLTTTERWTHANTSF